MGLIRGMIMTIKVHLRITMSRRMMQFVVIIEPLFTTYLMHLIYGESNNTLSSFYIIIGASLYSLWGNVCFSSAGDVERERMMGNLEMLTASPVGLQIIMLGKIFANSILGLISIALVIIFSALVLGVKLTLMSTPLFVLSFILVILSYTGIALFTSSLLTLSRSARLVMNFIDMPICFLSGLFFPIEILPKPIQFISYLLPTTWSVKVLEYSVTGNAFSLSITQCILILLGLSTVYFVSAFWLYIEIDKKARAYGSLGGY